MTDNSLPSRLDRRATKSRRGKRGVVIFLRDLLVIFVVALLISFLIKTFLVRSFYIPSASMNNTLLVDDHIIVNELEPTLLPIQRGDVIVFRDPGGWLEPQVAVQQNPIVASLDWLISIVGLSAPDNNDHLVKRVIGLPGDHVTCCNALGQMSVNNMPLAEPYIKQRPGETAASEVAFDVVVPTNSLWVMGDNRGNSRDSRYNVDKPGKGFVPISNVVGRAFAITWPLSRWSWIGNYSEVFRDVSAETK